MALGATESMQAGFVRDSDGRQVISQSRTGGPATVGSVAQGSVTNASSSIVAANPARKRLVITNESANVVYLGLGAAAQLNRGVRLAISGGAGSTFDVDGTDYTGDVRAIASVAGPSIVTVCEF